MIKVYISGNRADVTEREPLTSGTVGKVINFAFTEDWRPPYMEANLNFSRNLSVLGINGGSYTAVLGNIAPEGVSEFGCQTARLLKKGTKIEIWGVKS